jgi:hypothetical protein
VNPRGLHVQIFEASLHAVGRPAVATDVKEVLASGAVRCVEHALSSVMKSASIGARRMLNIIVGSRPSFRLLAGVYHEVRLGWKNARGSETQRGSRKMVPPAGFEPTAPGLGILCSIHLS